MVFIVYHQITELYFKLIIWELTQVVEQEVLNVLEFKEKVKRVTRYFDMLVSSFIVMKDGMSRAQYLEYRNTLAPASGFQSIQYRLIEYLITVPENLVDGRYRSSLKGDETSEDLLELMYWQAAGKNFTTGEKTYLLRIFEQKYKNTLIKALAFSRGGNLWKRFTTFGDEGYKDLELVSLLKHLDKTANIDWVMAHYETAVHYLEGPEGVKEATGGSDWKKYMLSKYQKRMFFPELWSQEEKENWGQ